MTSFADLSMVDKLLKHIKHRKRHYDPNTLLNTLPPAKKGSPVRARKYKSEGFVFPKHIDAGSTAHHHMIFGGGPSPPPGGGPGPAPGPSHGGPPPPSHWMSMYYVKTPSSEHGLLSDTWYGGRLDDPVYDALTGEWSYTLRIDRGYDQAHNKLSDAGKSGIFHYVITDSQLTNFVTAETGSFDGSTLPDGGTYYWDEEQQWTNWIGNLGSWNYYAPGSGIQARNPATGRVEMIDEGDYYFWKNAVGDQEIVVKFRDGSQEHFVPADWGGHIIDPDKEVFTRTAMNPGINIQQEGPSYPVDVEPGDYWEDPDTGKTYKFNGDEWNETGFRGFDIDDATNTYTLTNGTTIYFWEDNWRYEDGHRYTEDFDYDQWFEMRQTDYNRDWGWQRDFTFSGGRRVYLWLDGEYYTKDGKLWDQDEDGYNQDWWEADVDVDGNPIEDPHPDGWDFEQYGDWDIGLYGDYGDRYENRTIGMISTDPESGIISVWTDSGWQVVNTVDDAEPGVGLSDEHAGMIYDELTGDWVYPSGDGTYEGQKKTGDDGLVYTWNGTEWTWNPSGDGTEEGQTKTDADGIIWTWNGHDWVKHEEAAVDLIDSVVGVDVSTDKAGTTKLSDIWGNDYKLGDEVQGNWHGGGYWYLGHIIHIAQDKEHFEIEYADGDIEKNVPGSMLRDPDTAGGEVRTGVPIQPKEDRMDWAVENFITVAYDEESGHWRRVVIRDYDGRGSYKISYIDVDGNIEPSSNEKDPDITYVSADQLAPDVDLLKDINPKSIDDYSLINVDSVNDYLDNSRNWHGSDQMVGNWYKLKPEAPGGRALVTKVVGDQVYTIDAYDRPHIFWYQDDGNNWENETTDPRIPIGEPLHGEYYNTDDGNRYTIKDSDAQWDSYGQRWNYIRANGTQINTNNLQEMPRPMGIGAFVETTYEYDPEDEFDTGDVVGSIEEIRWDANDKDWQYLVKDLRTDVSQWTDFEDMSSYDFSQINAKDSLYEFLYNDHTGRPTNIVIDEWTADHYRSAKPGDLSSLIANDPKIRSIYDGDFSPYRVGDVIIFKTKSDSTGMPDTKVATIVSIDYESGESRLSILDGSGHHVRLSWEDLDTRSDAFETTGGLYKGQHIYAEFPAGTHTNQFHEKVQANVKSFDDDGVWVMYQGGQSQYHLSWDDVHKKGMISANTSMTNPLKFNTEYQTDAGEIIQITGINEETGEVNYVYMRKDGKWSNDASSFGYAQTATMTMDQMYFDKGITIWNEETSSWDRVLPEYNMAPDPETIVYMMEHDHIDHGTSITQWAQLYPQWGRQIQDALNDFSDNATLQKMMAEDPGWEDRVALSEEDMIANLYEEGESKYVWVWSQKYNDPDSDFAWRTARVNPNKSASSGGISFYDPFTNKLRVEHLGKTVSLIDRSDYTWTEDDTLNTGEDSWYFGGHLTDGNNRDMDPREAHWGGISDRRIKEWQDIQMIQEEIINDPDSTPQEIQAAQNLWDNAEDDREEYADSKRDAWVRENQIDIVEWLQRHPDVHRTAGDNDLIQQSEQGTLRLHENNDESDVAGRVGGNNVPSLVWADHKNWGDAEWARYEEENESAEGYESWGDD